MTQSKPKNISELQLLKERVASLESALEQSRAAAKHGTYYHELVKHAPVCIHDIDLHGRLINMNPAGLAMVNIDASAICGIPYLDFIGPDNYEEVKYLLERALEGKESPNFKFTVETDTGVKTFESNFIPIKSSDGQVQKLMGVTTDITEQVESKHKLIQAKNIAEKASQAKSELLANVSHELRTPLNGLLGASELLNDEVTTEEQKQLTGIIYQSAQTLVSLIDDFLDLSSIDANKNTLKIKPFSPKLMLNNIYQNFTALAKEKGLDFSIDIDSNMPETLLGDSVRIPQILFNLIGNAFKFTPTGKVQIIASAPLRSDGKVDLSINVIDTGIGIDKKDKEKIFETFTQLDMSNTKNHQGVGLGLSICKRLTDMMGGLITVKSAPSEGSSFFVQLPLAVEQSISNAPNIKEKLKRNYQKKVLLCEDNIVNQQIAKQMLTKLGIDVEVADGGLVAAELATRSQFDLILMDLQMPDLNGIETSERIRKTKLNRLTPIIAFTASDMQNVILRDTSNQLKGYLSKPLTLVDLINELDKWFG